MKALRLVIVLNLVVILMSPTPVYKSLSLIFSRAFDPILVKLTRLNSGLLSNLGLLVRFKTLAADNQKLQEELLRLRQKEVEAVLLTQENDLLKSQLKVKTGKKEMRLVLAKILARHTESGVGQIILDVGQNDGVAVGSLVVWLGNLLGTVTQTSSTKSKLRLTTSPASRVEASGLKFKARGEVWGSFGNQLKMTKVLPSQELAVGETIIEPASGLVLGRVDKIESESPKIFKEAQLSVFYEAELLSEVFVVLESND